MRKEDILLQSSGFLAEAITELLPINSLALDYPVMKDRRLVIFIVPYLLLVPHLFGDTAVLQRPANC